jgi:hypothetical protein
MRKCWGRRPIDRPNFDEVRAQLEGKIRWFAYAINLNVFFLLLSAVVSKLVLADPSSAVCLCCFVRRRLVFDLIHGCGAGATAGQGAPNRQERTQATACCCSFKVVSATPGTQSIS